MVYKRTTVAVVAFLMAMSLNGCRSPSAAGPPDANLRPPVSFPLNVSTAISTTPNIDVIIENIASPTMPTVTPGVATDPTTDPALAFTTQPATDPTEDPTVPEETVPPTEAPTEPTEETEPATEPIIQGPLSEDPAKPAETTPPETPVDVPVSPSEPGAQPTEPCEPPEEPTTPPTEPPVTSPQEPEPTQAPHQHKYTARVVAPSCTAGGHTVFTCSCGESYVCNQTKALGHAWSEWKVTKQATETTTGLEVRTCSTCGATESRTTPMVEVPVTEEAVAQAIVKYINQFRAEQGSTQLKYLPGMSQVAQYRSVQLVTNFAHDTADFREATAHYQYGEYFNWADYGCPEMVDQNYYDPHASEAIAYSSVRGSVDEIGYDIAAAFRDSSSHWGYVGSSEYSYLGVGCTYSDGYWYVCVLVGTVNYG